MKVSYSVESRVHKVQDPADVDYLLLLEEPLLSLWSRYGNGQIHVHDQNLKVSLGVDYVGEGRFFLDWHGDGRMVPYDGTACATFATIDMGGDPFRVPFACTLDKSTAARAIEYTARHGERDPGLHWTPMDDVPFAVGWYDA